MANPEQVELLRRGVEAWNSLRAEGGLSVVDLSEAELGSMNLSGVNLYEANLYQAKLREAHLDGAYLNKATLIGADLRRADLSNASLPGVNLGGANLSEANLNGAQLFNVNLTGADFSKATLIGADLSEATLRGANLSEATLRGANLSRADLWYANLTGADLTGANLLSAILIESDLTDADLTGCRIYGVSAWGLKLAGIKKQQNLVITPASEPEIAVDNIEVAQFVYLLLHNEKIRNVIDTIGKKGVLLLGRFTEGRIVVLQRLQEELRRRGYVPIVFNFDKPETKDFTETVRLLAGLSKFVIADITNPKSSPLELQATIPDIMVPFQPIIEHGEKPFAMLRDLWIKHRDWVFEPIEYSSVDRLVEVMHAEIIGPAEARFKELVMRKAETLTVRRV